MDNLNFIKNINLKECNSVILAYLGDVIWEFYLRQYWISKGLNLQNLNKKVTSCVNAKKQSELYKLIFPTIEEKYQAIGKRSKNGNIKTFPKSCTIMEYRESTAFEALIASFYVDKREDLIKYALKLCIKGENNNEIF